MSDCQHNTDPQKLVREGTSQDQRPFPALDPAYAPVNEQTPAHHLVFAQAYAAYLRYFDAGDVPVDHWQEFFSRDVSVQLAIASIQDVDFYKTGTLESFRFLNDRSNAGSDPDLKKHLGYLFSCAGTLAQRLDALKESLPPEINLKDVLRNLIRTQLAAGFGRLIAAYKGGVSLGIIDVAAVPAGIRILGSAAIPFGRVTAAGLSADWITDASPDWTTFEAGITADTAIYGGGSVFTRINRLSTHNLFTSVFDQFLKVYARTVVEAQKALESTFTNWDSHQPHYALFLAFLRLFEYARAEMNTLTGRHLDFYYRDILRLREKPARPGHAHLLVELAKHAASHEIKAGALFKAGKDASGSEAFFANNRDFVANQTRVMALKTVYRHGNEPVPGAGTNAGRQNGRLYASPVADSDDGLGAELTTADLSWHPFYNKIYDNGALQQIKMPAAELGFAIASHYLWLAEGERTITVNFTVGGAYNGLGDKVVCMLTTEKGWLEKTPVTSGADPKALVIKLSGEDPPVTPYLAKTHGYQFDTPLPVLLIKLRHDPAVPSIYPLLQDVVLKRLDLTVEVKGLKTLAVSNDFGPVDTSKPFQPFGALPVAGSSLTVGSKEVFQKKITQGSLALTWQNPPAPFSGSPRMNDIYLNEGKWNGTGGSYLFSSGANNIPLQTGSANAVVEAADFSDNEIYHTGSRHGFLRLALTDDFGQPEYQTALLNFLNKVSTTNPGSPPQGPVAATLTLDYTAKQTIAVDSADPAAFARRPARFFHLAPFGTAEQHPALNDDNKVTLLPQFRHTAGALALKHEAELYIGVAGLKPPQNLALLFQVAEGTADPLSAKPVPHLHWSCLRGNNWVTLEKESVEDLTGELTRSGIVTLAVPRDASDRNTVLPGGLHWIRVAATTESDTVCRVIRVAAQALQATFSDQGNDPAFSATPLEAGAISKLEQPDAAVKKIAQPFATFGGRGQEASADYYTRVSERLRHKERAITLWDYERLILEAFPQIYRVKCLNHTQYEPSTNGAGVYRELAAGHVTIVTIPNQQFQNLRDPLRPYTSLGLLLEIEAFVKQRLSCFATLHVKNPQFEEIRLDFRVRFHPGFDETFYTAQLKRDITRYLSPWAYPGGASPSFGGKIYKSVLINFVEERPYVDYVTDFKLFHLAGSTLNAVDSDEVEGSTAVSVLVSVPEEKHTILAINAAAASVQTSGDTCPCQS